MMNGAMHPVEIRVVNDKHDGDGEQVINDAELINFLIKIGVWTQNDHYQKENSCKYNGGLHGIDHFHPYAFVLWKNQLDLTTEELIPEQDVEQKIGPAGNKQIAQ